MKNILIALVLMVSPIAAFPAGGGQQHLEEVYINLGDKAGLQNGAKLFSNYCLSCHSAAFSRYNRVGVDLGISDENVKENLMFAAEKVGDLMTTTMPEEDAKKWFGVAPPDLSLIARSRSPDWLYTYMKSFYIDESSPSGWNNITFENVAMPHVLYELQGKQKAIYTPHSETVMEEDENGQMVEVVHESELFSHFEIDTPGKLTEQEYDKVVTDLVNFLVYLGEPALLQRYKIGVFVLLFLLVLLIPCYLMKKEYWRDVH